MSMAQPHGGRNNVVQEVVVLDGMVVARVQPAPPVLSPRFKSLRGVKMRRILVVESLDSQTEKLAEKLGCPEIASNVPRFEGYVKSLPAVVVESASNPGAILGIFNANMTSKDELDALVDLPVPPVPVIRDPVAEIDKLRAELEEKKIINQRDLVADLDSTIARLTDLEAGTAKISQLDALAARLREKGIL